MYWAVALGCSAGKLTVTVVVNECRLILLLVRVHSHHSLDKHRVIQLVLGNSVSLAKKAITSLSEMCGRSVPLELRRDMFPLVCVKVDRRVCFRHQRLNLH